MLENFSYSDIDLTTPMPSVQEMLRREIARSVRDQLDARAEWLKRVVDHLTAEGISLSDIHIQEYQHMLRTVVCACGVQRHAFEIKIPAIKYQG